MPGIGRYGFTYNSDGIFGLGPYCQYPTRQSRSQKEFMRKHFKTFTGKILKRNILLKHDVISKYIMYTQRPIPKKTFCILRCIR